MGDKTYWQLFLTGKMLSDAIFAIVPCNDLLDFLSNPKSRLRSVWRRCLNRFFSQSHFFCKKCICFREKDLSLQYKFLAIHNKDYSVVKTSKVGHTKCMSRFLYLNDFVNCIYVFCHFQRNCC